MPLNLTVSELQRLSTVAPATPSTASTTGGNMPLNLIQPQTPSTQLPRLASVYNEYAKLHMDNPNYWTRPEIFANCKDAIKRNINPHHGMYYPFATKRQPSWY
jgi:hypothetical protein